MVWGPMPSDCYWLAASIVLESMPFETILVVSKGNVISNLLKVRLVFFFNYFSNNSFSLYFLKVYIG